MAPTQSIRNRLTLETVAIVLNERARDTARAHYEYANRRFEGGLGSRLNMLRAQQELSADEARVEDARLAVRRAQEALGVLVATDGPIDVDGEPVFDLPSGTNGLDLRADFRPIAARQAAAERVLADSWKDRLPSVTGLFTPQYTAPTGLFASSRALRGSVVLTVPLFDGGSRTGLMRERSALLDAVKAERAGLERVVWCGRRAKPSGPMSERRSAPEPRLLRRTRSCRSRTSPSATVRRRTSK
jgi:outer membrane protein TolC